MIALRAYLSSQGSCGKLVLVCVGGDEWADAIEAAKQRLGIGKGSSVDNRLLWVHHTP